MQIKDKTSTCKLTLKSLLCQSPCSPKKPKTRVVPFKEPQSNMKNLKPLPNCDDNNLFLNSAVNHSFQSGEGGYSHQSKSYQQSFPVIHLKRLQSEQSCSQQWEVPDFSIEKGIQGTESRNEKDISSCGQVGNIPIDVSKVYWSQSTCDKSEKNHLEKRHYNQSQHEQLSLNTFRSLKSPIGSILSSQGNHTSRLYSNDSRMADESSPEYKMIQSYSEYQIKKELSDLIESLNLDDEQPQEGMVKTCNKQGKYDISTSEEQYLSSPETSYHQNKSLNKQIIDSDIADDDSLVVFDSKLEKISDFQDNLQSKFIQSFGADSSVLFSSPNIQIEKSEQKKSPNQVVINSFTLSSNALKGKSKTTH